MRGYLKAAAGLFVAVTLLLTAVWAGVHQYLDIPGALEKPVTLVIPKGAGLKAIALQLAHANVISSPSAFRIGTMALGKAKAMRAGEYAFRPGMTPRAVLDKLVAGDVVIHHFTLVEGRTVRQVFEELRAEPSLEGEAGAMPPEGRMLPETYNFVLGDSRVQLVGRMVRAMDEALAEAWNGRAEGLPLETPAELLILASIVERETGIAAERPRVAAVFVNRLKKGMRLQSDPTVIYDLSDGLGVAERPLSKADLESMTPHNTYVLDRLPPGPIANPGRASLLAAAHPLNSDDLYFVADGTGGHAFSASLEGHNQNVANWRKLEKGRKK